MPTTARNLPQETAGADAHSRWRARDGNPDPLAAPTKSRTHAGLAAGVTGTGISASGLVDRRACEPDAQARNLQQETAGADAHLSRWAQAGNLDQSAAPAKD